MNHPLDPSAWAGIAFLLGAIQALSPERWASLSLFAWQRGWRFRKTVSVTLAGTFFHSVVAMGIYFAIFRPFWGILGPDFLFRMSAVLVLIISVIRMRDHQARGVPILMSPSALWSGLGIAGRIGVAESMIPLLVKTGVRGTGYLSPILAFALGASLVGVAWVLFGRVRWNRPGAIPQWASLSSQKELSMPMMLGLTLGLVAILFRAA